MVPTQQQQQAAVVVERLALQQHSRMMWYRRSTTIVALTLWVLAGLPPVGLQAPHVAQLDLYQVHMIPAEPRKGTGKGTLLRRTAIERRTAGLVFVFLGAKLFSCRSHSHISFFFRCYSYLEIPGDSCLNARRSRSSRTLDY